MLQVDVQEHIIHSLQEANCKFGSGGVPYTMTAGCISGSNTQVAIWIDYNQNGIF